MKSVPAEHNSSMPICPSRCALVLRMPNRNEVSEVEENPSPEKNPAYHYPLSVAGILTWALGVSIWAGSYRRVLILIYEQTQPNKFYHDVLVLCLHITSSIVLGLLFELLLIGVLRKEPRLASTRWIGSLFMGTQVTWLLPDPWGEPMACISGLVIAVAGMISLMVSFWRKHSIIERLLASLFSMELVDGGAYRVLWYYSIAHIKSDYWVKKSIAIESAFRVPFCLAFLIAAFLIAAIAFWRGNKDWRCVVVFLLIGVYHAIWLVLPWTL